ncbi:interleukin-10 receptor subunit beta-like [Pelodytes ibericus]
MTPWYKRLVLFSLFFPGVFHKLVRLITLLSLYIAVFGASVSSPTNLTMDSVDFKSILRWNLPSDIGKDTTYRFRGQYKLDVSVRDFTDVCITRIPECDFSVVKYDSLIRVRTEVNNTASEWVTIRFDPYEQTVISAPKVQVTSRVGNLDVSFSDPKYEGGSLKDKYGEWIYRLLYWKQNKTSEVRTIETKQNYETITDLDQHTTYCIKVQIYVTDFNNSGQFSPVICKATTDNGKPLPWQIAAAFMVSMLLATCVAVALFYVGLSMYQTAKYIFYPSYSFPDHLKEFLNKPFHSSPYLPTQPVKECEELCEELLFVSEENKTQTV